jgi:hypothetical protein
MEDQYTLRDCSVQGYALPLNGFTDMAYHTIYSNLPGRLFGKIYMMAKNHVVDFEDMPQDEMIGFMRMREEIKKV